MHKFSYYQEWNNGEKTCSIFDSINVNLYPVPHNFLIADTSICEGDSILLVQDFYPKLNYTYKWLGNNSNDSHFFAKKSGKYILKVNNETCFSYDTTNLNVINPPSKYNFSDTLICDFQSVSYWFSPKGLFNILWNDNSSDSIKTISEEGTYFFHLENRCGIVNDSFLIQKKDCKLFIPNIFTPNNDFKNDFFELLNLEYNPCSVQIYNRWGDEIYKNEQYNNSWDGNNEADGLYFYRIINKRTGEEFKNWLQISR